MFSGKRYRPTRGGQPFYVMDADGDTAYIRDHDGTLTQMPLSILVDGLNMGLVELDTKLFDVVAVNIETGATRRIATGEIEEEAEAIVKLAVMRRGVDEEFFKVVPHE
jgi:hypothetical protein